MPVTSMCVFPDHWPTTERRAGRHQAAGRWLRRAEVGGQPARLAARPPVLQGVGAAEHPGLDPHQLGLGDARMGRDAVAQGARGGRRSRRRRGPPCRAPAAIDRSLMGRRFAIPLLWDHGPPEPSPLRLVGNPPREEFGRDEQAQHDPEERVHRRLLGHHARVRRQRRPAPGAPVRVEPVDQRQARPGRDGFRSRPGQAGLWAAPARQGEGRPERRAVGGVHQGARDRPAAPAPGTSRPSRRTSLNPPAQGPAPPAARPPPMRTRRRPPRRRRATPPPSRPAPGLPIPRIDAPR